MNHYLKVGLIALAAVAIAVRVAPIGAIVFGASK